MVRRLTRSSPITVYVGIIPKEIKLNGVNPIAGGNVESLRSSTASLISCILKFLLGLQDLRKFNSVNEQVFSDFEFSSSTLHETICTGASTWDRYDFCTVAVEHPSDMKMTGKIITRSPFFSKDILPDPQFTIYLKSFTGSFKIYGPKVPIKDFRSGFC